MVAGKVLPSDTDTLTSFTTASAVSKYWTEKSERFRFRGRNLSLVELIDTCDL